MEVLFRRCWQSASIGEKHLCFMFMSVVFAAENLLLGAIGGEDQSDPITISVPGGGIRVLRRGAIDMPAAISADGRRVLYTAGRDGPPVNIRVNGTRGSGK